MKSFQWGFLLVFMLQHNLAPAQTTSIASPTLIANRTQFFDNDRVLQMTITTDFKKIFNEKKKGNYQDGFVTLNLLENELITDSILLYARGEYRRQNCKTPGLMLNFNAKGATRLNALKKLKLTCACSNATGDEQLLLIEYLIYKMYNLITDMSFRVKLVNVSFNDVQNKMKPYTQYAFFIEDVDDMAARNECFEMENIMFMTEQTHRRQMTLLSIFQYMIGNTDWAVPTYHNIKLIRSNADSKALPYAVPYDFDFAGMVNAYYALPHPDLGIEKVTDRLYRGFPRTMPEIQAALDVFRDQKQNILSLISSFDLIRKKEQNFIYNYIEEFYKIIESERQVKAAFIDGARYN